MTARPLGMCPTCFRPLDDTTRQAMGLRNGEVLNSLCPGRVGPSDIDHVLHNGHGRTELVMFIEYKRGGAVMLEGQARLFRALNGDWEEHGSGRLLSVRHAVLPLLPDDPEAEVRPLVEWLWPNPDAQGRTA